MIHEKIVEKNLIDKGWSPDKKYRIVTDDGNVYLLRTSPPERLEQVKGQVQRMAEVEQLGIPMCRNLEWGVCEEGPYVIQNWIEGKDMESQLSSMTGEQQYAYGMEAGRILKKIHSIPAPADTRPWGEYFRRKIDRKLLSYAACPLKYKNGEKLVEYVQAHRHLLSDRPQTLQHGDYHCGNLMIDTSGQIQVIDFDKWDYGDPWEEFNRIVWCAQCAPEFARGRVDGYFDGEVPEEFWKLLALYICNNSLGSLPWSIPFGEDEINVMRRQAANILRWYDNFRTVIPSWYHK